MIIIIIIINWGSPSALFESDYRWTPFSGLIKPNKAPAAPIPCLTLAVLIFSVFLAPSVSSVSEGCCPWSCLSVCTDLLFFSTEFFLSKLMQLKQTNETIYCQVLYVPLLKQ